MYFSIYAFHDLAKQLLPKDGVDYILSNKSNQDLLEEHFREQIARGNSNENPSLKECTDNNCWLQIQKWSVPCEEILVVDRKNRP